MSYPDQQSALQAALDELSHLAQQAKELATDREANRQLGAAERFELKAHVLNLCIKTIRRHLAAVQPRAGRADGA